MNNPTGTVTFICIHCLNPTTSSNGSKPGEECGRLYKRYGNDTIKLSDCCRCHNYIDEYCEREWLLVILDLILFRPQAFRHVLYNRWKQQQQQEHTECWQVVPSIIPYLSISSALLRAHVGVVATQDRVTIEQTLWAMLQFVPLAAISWIGYLLQILVVQIGIVIVISTRIRRRSTGRDQPWRRLLSNYDRELMFETSLAILLPATLTYGLTAFLFLWEISETILRLATGLIMAYQWMAIWTILLQQSVRMKSDSPHEKMTPDSSRGRAQGFYQNHWAWRIVTMVILGFSVAIRASIMEWMAAGGVLAWMTSPHSHMPCPGWKWILSRKELCLAG
jgi:hypothetical protein